MLVSFVDDVFFLLFFFDFRGIIGGSLIRNARNDEKEEVDDIDENDEDESSENDGSISSGSDVVSIDVSGVAAIHFLISSSSWLAYHVATLSSLV